MKATSNVTHDKAELAARTKIGEVKASITEQGIEIYLEGYGTATDPDGAPIFIDFFEGYPKLYVWGNINDEDYTDVIAVEPNRVKLGEAREMYREED